MKPTHSHRYLNEAYSTPPFADIGAIFRCLCGCKQRHGGDQQTVLCGFSAGSLWYGSTSAKCSFETWTRRHFVMWVHIELKHCKVWCASQLGQIPVVTIHPAYRSSYQTEVENHAQKCFSVPCMWYIAGWSLYLQDNWHDGNFSRTSNWTWTAYGLQ